VTYRGKKNGRLKLEEAILQGVPGVKGEGKHGVEPKKKGTMIKPPEARRSQD